MLGVEEKWDTRDTRQRMSYKDERLCFFFFFFLVERNREGRRGFRKASNEDSEQTVEREREQDEAGFTRVLDLFDTTMKEREGNGTTRTFYDLFLLLLLLLLLRVSLSLLPNLYMVSFFCMCIYALSRTRT